MKININSLFEKSFVISINTDRYKTFCDRFNASQLNMPLPKLFNGFTIPNGIYKECGLVKTKNLCNCFFSHIALVKMAQTMDLEYIGIFEDDAYPCNKCREILQDILQNIPNDIDLLKMGHLGCIGDRHSINKKFEEVKTYGSHAYIVFKKYYNKYIEISNKDLHIDRLAMNTSPNSKIYSTLPMLFMQEDSYFTTTLHDNKKYKSLLKEQGYLAGFDVK